jgi:hypothetical protein
LDSPLQKWCPAVALSRQDGRHSAVALLLKAALIQVSDYRLLGASGSVPELLSLPNIVGRLIVFAPFLIIIKSPKQRLETYCFCSVSYYYFYYYYSILCLYHYPVRSYQH